MSDSYNFTSLPSIILLIFNSTADYLLVFNSTSTSKSYPPEASMKMGILGLSKEDRFIGTLNYYISFGFAIVFNGLLCFAVMRRSTKILEAYHKVFYFTIISDVLLSVFSVLTMFQPIGATLNGTSIYFHIVEGLIFDPPQPWTTILASITIFFGIYNITVSPISFIYRYLIICHNFEMPMLQFLFCCFIAALGPGAYALTILIAELTAPHELKHEAAKLFENTDWLDSEGHIPHFGVMYASKSSPNAYITPIVVIISYAIVIFCTIKISVKIAKLRLLQQSLKDVKARRSQSQLQVVLYCQAIVPFITSALSTFAIQTGKILGLTNPWWFYYLNLLNCWAPVANPLIALLVIAPYRKFILRPFGSRVAPDSTEHQSYVASQRTVIKTLTVT